MFRDRLFNFNGTGTHDSTINRMFLPQLQILCPENGDGSMRVALDTGSVNRFDTSFFANLRDGKGVLQSDQALWSDASTRILVQHFLGVRGMFGSAFNIEFGRSMIKMSNIEVKTDTSGEIRRICSTIN